MPGLVVSQGDWIVTPEKQSVFRPHKHLPRNRTSEPAAADLRALYNSPGSDTAVGRRPTTRKYIISNSVTATELPPTPPIANIENGEDSRDGSSIAETTILRSGVVTPTLQQSPLTPDNTPPRHRSHNPSRPSLGTQPSMTSTRAESFTTAREDFASDEETDSLMARSQNGRNILRSRTTPDRALLRPSPLTHEASEDARMTQPPDNGNLNAEKTPDVKDMAGSDDNGAMFDKLQKPKGVSRGMESSQIPTSNLNTLENAPPSASPPLRSSRVRSLQHEMERPIARGPSLRERLEARRDDFRSPSMEQFASDIGWTSSTTEGPQHHESVRLPEVSPSSGDAFVEDDLPVRRQTLRHRSKQLSLRIASSPIPASQRDSMWSNSDSPQRSLTHKKVKLSNQDRSSFGSEMSQSLSTTSSVVTPSKPEVIRVAVIPERRSTWQYSPSSSKRDSANTSADSGSQVPLLDAGHQWGHRGTMSEASPNGVSTRRGRDKLFPPHVPARGSSLSAPTSRSNSRSNSITSEHARGRRLAAEADLRKTLDRMESDRAVLSLRDLNANDPQPVVVTTRDLASDKWTALRPPIDTPYSQPSVQSASPGLVETGQAKAINLFPHTNNSLQLIESNPLPESRAVTTLRHTGHVRRVSDEDDYSVPMTPRSETYVSSVDSPLRNPRQPPQPPRLKVVPATPSMRSPTKAVTTDQEYRGATRPVRTRTSGAPRPSINDRRRSDSFMKSITRSVSLNQATNRKADQSLDGSLYPMWRPRAFWDDVERSDPDGQFTHNAGVLVDGTALPRRTTINGPLSLIRSISNSSRRLRPSRPGAMLHRHNSSQLSLTAIQAGQTPTMRTLAGMRRPLQLGSWTRRLLSLRRKKEDEQRERRRELLRQSIGVDIISQGDSRFPQERVAGGTEPETMVRRHEHR